MSFDDDPLAPVSSRFPLGPPPEYWTSAQEPPSEVGIRSFLLRGAVPIPPMEMAKHTTPGATKADTTGYKTDGDPQNPPPEEYGAPDYQTD